jgi:hypothetical protein
MCIIYNNKIPPYILEKWKSESKTKAFLHKTLFRIHKNILSNPTDSLYIYQ